MDLWGSVVVRDGATGDAGGRPDLKRRGDSGGFVWGYVGGRPDLKSRGG